MPHHHPATEIEKALALQRDGKPAQAERVYARVLAADPRNLDALHLSALLFHSRGKNKKAIALLKRAVALAPRQTVLYYNLGEMQRADGDFAAAGAAFDKVVEMDADHVDAHNGLGLCLAARGRLNEAIVCLQKAAELAPESLGVKMNLGTTLLSAGQAARAGVVFRAASTLTPTAVEAFIGWAEAASAQGQTVQAHRALQLATRRFPDSARIHAELGEYFEAQGEARNAAQCFRKSLALDEDDPHGWRALGNAYSDLGEIEAAQEAYARALRLRPDFAEVICDLGVLAMDQGDPQGAIERYRKAVRMNPEYTVAHQNLAQAKKYGPGDDDEIRRFETLSRRKNLSTDARASLHFALGKMYDDSGAFESAFRHYEQGNRIKHASTDFDVKALNASVDRLIETFTHERMAKLGVVGSREQSLVFIVGMPRSGTTLIEQILAAHSQIFGAGELPFIDRISKRIPDLLGTGSRYPDCLHEVTEAVLQSCAGEYLDLTRVLAPGAMRITDKMPTNFFHLGLIAVLFPCARIIHSRRNSLDTCLSAYFQHFASGNTWSYDLADIGEFYLAYTRLMRHWRDTVPAGFLDVDYETLIGDVGTTGRGLIEYCGLPWDDACSRYHENKRLIRTASAWQARQPVYSSSAGRWRNYTPFLGSLMEKLGIAQ